MYDIYFVPQKVIKRQAKAVFLTNHLVLEGSKLHGDILDEVAEVNVVSNEQGWQLFFDEVVRRAMTKVGVVLISPHKHMISRGYSPTKLYTNNVAKYNTLSSL